MPFTIQGPAPSNALYVAANGRIGLGTVLPQTNLQLEGVDRVGLRLNKTGSPRRAWEFWTGGTGVLYFEDVTNDTFPIYMAPNMDTGRLAMLQSGTVFNATNDDVDFRVATAFGEYTLFAHGGTGLVGMGTAMPTAPLHMVRSTGLASDSAGILVENIGANLPRGLLKLSNNGQVYFGLEDISIAAGDNTGRQWNFQNNGGEFRVTTAPGGGSDIEMRLTTGGDMIIEGNYFASSGTQLTVPDYVFAPNYDLKPLAEVQAFIETHSHLPGVPSAAEINAEGLNMTDMQMRLLKKVEELTLYTLQLEATNQSQEAELARLRTIEARMDRLEQALAAQ